jgi:hypothetical protein
MVSSREYSTLNKTTVILIIILLEFTEIQPSFNYKPALPALETVQLVYHVGLWWFGTLNDMLMPRMSCDDVSHSIVQAVY